MVLFTNATFYFYKKQFIFCKMVVLFIFCMVVCYHANAQSSQQEKKLPVNKSDTSGFYPRSVLPSNDKVIAENDNPQSENFINQNSSPPLETIFVDYFKMPFAVQKKMDLNKLNGKSLLNGIEKRFNIEIKYCTDERESKKILYFLENEKGFLRFELVSPGILNIYVSCGFDIDYLDDLMVANKIEYNFMNEFYLVKN